MRLLICGDRNWKNKDLIREKVTEFLASLEIHQLPLVIIEGEATGADIMGAQVAQELGIEVNSYPANWVLHHKAAGPIRNSKMLFEGKPDIVFAFHNKIADSKGTKDMVTKAQKVGVPVRIFTE